MWSVLFAAFMALTMTNACGMKFLYGEIPSPFALHCNASYQSHDLSKVPSALCHITFRKQGQERARTTGTFL